MNQDSLNKMRALTQKRRQLVEDSVNSQETAKKMLQESGYLEEDGSVAEKYQGGLSESATIGSFYKYVSRQYRDQFMSIPGSGVVLSPLTRQVTEKKYTSLRFDNHEEAHYVNPRSPYVEVIVIHGKEAIKQLIDKTHDLNVYLKLPSED